LSAFGGIYNLGEETIEPVATTPAVVPMESAMTLQDVTATPENSLTVNTAGIYEIAYSVSFTTSISQTPTVAVRVNGTVIPETAISRTLAANEEATFSANNIRVLAAGDVVDLVVTSPATLTVTLEDDLSAYLILKRLD